MSDTIQVVHWALERPCKLRQADAVQDPVLALTAVGRAQTYSDYLRRQSRGFGMFGDLCVTAITSADVPVHLKGRRVNYPCGGFVISDAFRDIGGGPGLTAMCRECPANTRGDRPAGCAGTLYQRPGSPETQAQLEGIISRLGLDAEFGEAFLPTTPVWYGLWARSPLSGPAVRLLRVIIGAMCEEDVAELEREGRAGTVRGDHLDELREFVRAAELAEANGLRLHVSLAPPGHTDLGWYTVFPHCPVCKAAARLPRWRREYPTALYACEACGTKYPPAETASSERDRYESSDLRDELGERFPAFARAYLVAQGLSDADAAEVVARNEARERERQQKLADVRRRARRQDQFVRAVLFAGLHPVDDRDEDDGGSDGDDTGRLALFDATEFAEVLRRCEDKGINVLFMLHRSKAEQQDRYERPDKTRPLELLARWQAEGCRERFAATFGVQDALLDAFTAAGE